MTFNLGCNKIVIKILERCTYSHTFSKCRCHLYDLMKFERVSDAYDKPVEYCNNITGFFAKDWLEEISPKGKLLMKYADQCQVKRSERLEQNKQSH